MNTNRNIFSTRRYLINKLESLDYEAGKDESSFFTDLILATRPVYKKYKSKELCLKQFFKQLEDLRIIDLHYPVSGCIVWLENGMPFRNLFIKQMTDALRSKEYSEVLFPSLISEKSFDTLRTAIYDFSDVVFNVEKKKLKYILKPTGETAIYPTVARWLKSGTKLPIKIFQSGPFYRYKSKVNSYLSPLESSFMVEAHGFFSTKSEMALEFKQALKICSKWSNLLCFDCLEVDRPVFLNKPVSTKTIGFDTIVPWGQTLQTSVAYIQDRIYSKAFNICYPNKNIGEDGSKNIFQITFGISERNALTCLLLHSDQLGMRMPSNLAPSQISITTNKNDKKGSKIANELFKKLVLKGFRVKLVVYNKMTNCFKREINLGTPVHIWLTKSMTLKTKAIIFQRHNSEIIECELGAIEKMSLEALEKSDLVLRIEQSKIKQESQFQFGDEARTKNKSVISAFIHNKKSCINKLSDQGLGEIIGFDYLNLISKDKKKCMVCEKSSSSVQKCFIAHRI